MHSEGLEAQLNTFYKNAMEQCNVGLPTACQSGMFLCEVVDVRAKHAVTYNMTTHLAGTKVYTASTHIPALSAAAMLALPSTTINAMSHGFRVVCSHTVDPNHPCLWHACD